MAQRSPWENKTRNISSKYQVSDYVGGPCLLTSTSKVAADVFTIPWIVEMSNQIVANLSENTEWIGIKRSESDGNSQTIKMLDYACGNGLASRVSCAGSA